MSAQCKSEMGKTLMMSKGLCNNPHWKVWWMRHLKDAGWWYVITKCEPEDPDEEWLLDDKSAFDEVCLSLKDVWTDYLLDDPLRDCVESCETARGVWNLLDYLHIKIKERWSKRSSFW